jgi:hypothetical protein
LIAVRASKRAVARDVSVMDRENANLSAIPADGIRAAAKKQDFGTSRWQLGGFNSMSVQAAYKVGRVVGRGVQRQLSPSWQTGVMSAHGTKRTFQSRRAMSGFGGKAENIGSL